MTGFPWRTAPPSAAVDLLGLASGRSAIRFRLPGDVDLAQQCAHAHGLSMEYDGIYAVWSRSEAHGRRVMQVDRSRTPHVAELGDLLGYPSCCTNAAQASGEAGIDALAAAASRWRLSGERALLDISEYSGGVALLSHVPCGPDCLESVAQARAALAVAVRLASTAANPGRWQAIATRFRDHTSVSPVRPAFPFSRTSFHK